MSDMERKNFYPGDVVDYDGSTWIVIGSYGLLHANTMDNIHEGRKDPRFNDYRILNPMTGKIPITWIKGDLMTLVKDMDDQDIIDRIEHIYDIIIKADEGHFQHFNPGE